jgi:hypothetical protein
MTEVNVYLDATAGMICSTIVALKSVILMNANGIRVSVLSLSTVMSVSMYKDLILDNLVSSLMPFLSMI